MNRNKNTFAIGPQEFTYIVIALAVLTVGAIIFVIGAASYNRSRSLTAIDTATPGAGVAEMSIQGTPTPVIAAIAPPAESTSLPEGETVPHIVQSGESLFSIATLYGVDFDSLLNANGLNAGSIIKAGQTILIPNPAGQAGTYHEVRAGESLISIADLYGVDPEQIKSANNLTNADQLHPGQSLLIPGVSSSAASVPVADAEIWKKLETTGPLLSDWPRSLLEDDLDENYPNIYEHPRFTVHYQPGTYPDVYLGEVITLLEDSLEYVEALLDVHLVGTFDIYLAGTLYETPNAHLRGLSGSKTRELFLLLDGSGDAAENSYLVRHEMTHLVSWNTWGMPNSTMISEGLATYAGKSALEEAGYMSYDDVCIAAYDANVMSSMAVIERDFQVFRGHIRHRFNYFGSGCFVDYLISNYGMEPMSKLYYSGNYPGLYNGLSLASLDANWQAELDAKRATLTIDSAEMVSYTREVSNAYSTVFYFYDGEEQLHLAYTAVDQARIALWRGNYEDVRAWLDETYRLLGR